MTEEPMRLARISLWCLASLNVLRGIELLVTMALTHAAWQASASASADLSDQMTLKSLMLNPFTLMACGTLIQSLAACLLGLWFVRKSWRIGLWVTSVVSCLLCINLIVYLWNALPWLSSRYSIYIFSVVNAPFPLIDLAPLALSAVALGITFVSTLRWLLADHPAT